MISDAIRYGDCHRTTMEMADYWLLEKQLVHKLFKVLVPRYQNSELSYTKIYKAPREYPGIYFRRSVLELRGNPYPALENIQHQNRNQIHNILLDEARKDFQKTKIEEMAARISAQEKEKSS